MIIFILLAIFPLGALAGAAALYRLRTLHGMASWDRRDVEIERARQGLPPLDDLSGMASWDVKEVMKARARYGEGRQHRSAKSAEAGDE